MAKQLTAPGCTYTIVARVDTTIYSPDQKWTLDVPAGQHDFIAETNEIIIPGDAMLVRKSESVDKDLERVNVLGNGSGSLATFVTRAVEQIVGKGNVKISYSSNSHSRAAGHVDVTFGLTVTNAQVTAARELLAQQLPKDLAVDMVWEDGMPATYTRLAWLEATGTQRILTPYKLNNNSRVEVVFEPRAWGWVNMVYGDGCNDGGPNCALSYGFNGAYDNCMLMDYGPQGKYATSLGRTKLNKVYHVIADAGKWYADGKLIHTFNPATFETKKTIPVFESTWYAERSGYMRIYSFNISEGGSDILNFVPALDPTGAPCMFDTVTKKPFYNDRTGEFVYSIDVPHSATYGLRSRMFAQLTEHGLRRLYHTPEGYNGSKEEYAAENGFKLLVETPMPEEGYWEPVWREHEDYIELEWIATEPPPEEAPANV